MKTKDEDEIGTVNPFLKAARIGKCCGCFQLEIGCMVILVLEGLSAIAGFTAFTIPDFMLGIPKIAAVIFGAFALKLKDKVYAKITAICFFICVPIYAWCFIYFLWLGKSAKPFGLGGKAPATYNTVLGLCGFFGMFLHTYWTFVWMSLSYRFNELEEEEAKQGEEEEEMEIELELSGVHESLECGEEELEKNAHGERYIYLVGEIQNETASTAGKHDKEISIIMPTRDQKIVSQKKSEGKHIRFADPVKSEIKQDEEKRRQVFKTLKLLEEPKLRMEERKTTQDELAMNALFIEQSTASESQPDFRSCSSGIYSL